MSSMELCKQIVFMIVVLLLMTACRSNSFVMKNNIKTENLVIPSICANRHASLSQKFNPHRNNDLACCIIDGASKGDVECEDFIIAHISEYDPQFSNGYLFCKETKMRAVVSKKIAEAQYRHLESNPNYFKCVEGIHSYYCPGNDLTMDLIDGIRLLNNMSIDGTEFFTEELPITGDTNHCGCDSALAFFNSLRRHIEMGNVDLRPYLNQPNPK
jgi:hypothetical protein